MTGATPEITIALSTWNGAAFIRDQLQSFMGQTHAAWHVIWRDDDSRDATPVILRDFAALSGQGRFEEITDLAGHAGISASFMRLLRAAPRDNIVAFADQDDVWMPEKLTRGLAAFARIDPAMPALYCARQILVDRDLHEMRASARLAEPPGFPQSLAQNIATGCTVMLNQAAASLIANSKAPPATMHDWWSYIVVTAAGGRVLVDEIPVVLYRQHGGNAVGVPSSTLWRAFGAITRGPGAFMSIFRAHALALAQQPELLTAENRAQLELIMRGLEGGFAARAKALWHTKLRRQDVSETILFWIWLLLG
jgi:hypothetical protein